MSQPRTIDTDNPTAEDLIDAVLGNFDGAVRTVRQNGVEAQVVPSRQDAVRIAERLQASMEEAGS